MIVQLNHHNYLQHISGVMTCLKRFGDNDISFASANSVMTKKIDNGDVILVYKEDGDTVATASMLVEWKLIHGGSKVGHIEDVATREGFEGKGYASQLIKELKNMAKIIGCYKVILNCSPENEPFYEKHGFYTNEYGMRYDAQD